METDSGAEFISSAHVRHVLRYVTACNLLPPDSSLILDAACGTGYGTKIIAREFQRATIYGVDYSQDAINEALKEPSPRCRFIHMDMLQGAPGQMDAIVSIETIEHFKQGDGVTIVKNFARWLRYKGCLVISTPYSLTTGPSNITKQHLCEYSLTDFEQLLSKAGFNIEQMLIDRHEGQEGLLGYCMVRAIKI